MLDECIQQKCFMGVLSFPFCFSCCMLWSHNRWLFSKWHWWKTWLFLCNSWSDYFLIERATFLYHFKVAASLLIRHFLYLLEDTLMEIRVVYTKDLAEWIQETQNILFKQVSWQNNHRYNNISIIQMNRAHVGNSKQNVQKKGCNTLNKQSFVK